MGNKVDEDDQEKSDDLLTFRRRNTWTRNAVEHLETNLALFETFCGYTALVLQLAYLGWVFFALLHPIIDLSGRLGDGETPGYAITVEVWIPLIYFVVLIYIALAWICFTLPSYEMRCLPISVVAGIACVTAYAIALVVLFTWCERESVIELLVGGLLAVITYLRTLVVMWVLGEPLVFDSFFRSKVLLVEREHTQEAADKSLAIAAWSIFAGTLILAICYYMFRYDSAGTYKPTWTKVLG
jgi:hypothetical protein